MRRQREMSLRIVEEFLVAEMGDDMCDVPQFCEVRCDVLGRHTRVHCHLTHLAIRGAILKAIRCSVIFTTSNLALCKFQALFEHMFVCARAAAQPHSPRCQEFAAGRCTPSHLAPRPHEPSMKRPFPAHMRHFAHTHTTHTPHTHHEAPVPQPENDLLTAHELRLVANENNDERSSSPRSTMRQ